MSTDLDASRKVDLEMISEGIKNARSYAEREDLEHIAQMIINESTDVRSLREDLIKAVRSGDTRAVERISAHIQYIKMKETNGRSWGSTKTNIGKGRYDEKKKF